MNLIILWKKIKGFKTIAIAVLTAIIALLNGIDWIDLSANICSLLETVVHIWNAEWVCSTNAIINFEAVVLAAVMAALRFVTSVPVFDKK